MAQLTAQMSELVRSEFALARTELAEKGKRAGVGAGLAGAAGVVALMALATLVAAAVAALALVWPVWLAAVVVAAALLVVAGLLALGGRSQLAKAAPPVPDGVVQSVQDDVTAVREAVQHR